MVVNVGPVFIVLGVVSIAAGLVLVVYHLQLGAPWLQRFAKHDAEARTQDLLRAYRRESAAPLTPEEEIERALARQLEQRGG